MSGHRRAQLVAGVIALAVIVGVWALVRWTTARPWLALVCAVFVAGVAYRLVLEVPAAGPVVQSWGEGAARWLRELLRAGQ